MEGGGGTGDASASHGGDVVCISLPDVASGGSATPLPGIARGAGPIFLLDAPTGDAPPSLAHLWVTPLPPLLGAAVGDGRTPLPGVAVGGAPIPTPLLLWSAATDLEVWHLLSRSSSLRCGWMCSRS
jgi:hypothetical protein